MLTCASVHPRRPTRGLRSRSSWLPAQSDETASAGLAGIHPDGSRPNEHLIWAPLESLRDMAERLEVSVDELRAAVARVLDAAEKRLGQQIEITEDVYWTIFPSDAFKPEPSVVAGSLADDLQTLREVVRRGDAEEDALLLWHDLDHLIGLLQWLVYVASGD